MSLAINIQLKPTINAPRYVGWRVKHKVEGGNQNTPPGMPEVTPPIESVAIEMTEAIQVMSYDLMSENPYINPKSWTRVHDHDRAFTNFNGFDKPGDPRRNYITGEDLNAELPKYDKAQRVCGGSFIRGEVRGDRLVCIPSVHGIDAKVGMPPVSAILANNWFIHAVSIGVNDESAISHFPQGGGGAVLIPFIFDREIEFPLAFFERWERDYLPDPLAIGG